MSFLSDADAERRYTWWRTDRCPSCGCGMYARDQCKVIAEGVMVCGCCAVFSERMSEEDVTRILAQLVLGANLFGGSG